MSERQKSPKSTTAGGKRYQGFTAEERAAMKEAVREQKRSRADADGENEVLEKIADMQGSDRVIAERLHAVIKASAPGIAPKTWYGMPAYAKDGNTICFFQPAQKFKSRFATLGFSDKANLDEGDIWPIYFAVPRLTPAVEAKVAELVKKAVS